MSLKIESDRSVRKGNQKVLRLTFRRAKLRRHIFMTRAEVWVKNWAKFSVHFCASFAVQNDPQIFSQKSSQFITACLVTEFFQISSPRASAVWGAEKKVTENEKVDRTPFADRP